jgi:SAM-dependent methyltransferase
MQILNLGCGTKTSSHPDVVNIDWSIYLRLKQSSLLRVLSPVFLHEERLRRFIDLPNNILVHNLAKGIPFRSDSVDVVYHSHMLEHLDKSLVEGFFTEVKRVLKPGGLCRIVVPDLEYFCKKYLDHLAICDVDLSEKSLHDNYIANIIEQCVRKESFGTSKQTPLRRKLENIILGDARKRGETHQWMYDRVNLTQSLLATGYKSVVIQKYNTSGVPDWALLGLDLDERGHEYKIGSLYVEAMK